MDIVHVLTLLAFIKNIAIPKKT